MWRNNLEINLKKAQEYEIQGFLAFAAFEYRRYYEYFEECDFPWGMDAASARLANQKYNELLKKLPYAQLSKSTFIKGYQCPRALWLYKNKFDQRHLTEEQKKNSKEATALAHWHKNSSLMEKMLQKALILTAINLSKTSGLIKLENL